MTHVTITKSNGEAIVSFTCTNASQGRKVAKAYAALHVLPSNHRVVLD